MLLLHLLPLLPGVALLRGQHSITYFQGQVLHPGPHVPQLLVRQPVECCVGSEIKIGEIVIAEDTLYGMFHSLVQAHIVPVEALRPEPLIVHHGQVEGTTRDQSREKNVL